MPNFLRAIHNENAFNAFLFSLMSDTTICINSIVLGGKGGCNLKVGDVAAMAKRHHYTLMLTSSPILSVMDCTFSSSQVLGFLSLMSLLGWNQLLAWRVIFLAGVISKWEKHNILF